MVIPPSFIDQADEEAYERARERLVCEYCDKEYSSRKRLNEPIEIYSSNRTVKRWIVVCRICAVLIKAYDRKKNSMMKKKHETVNYFYYENDESV